MSGGRRRRNRGPRPGCSKDRSVSPVDDARDNNLPGSSRQDDSQQGDDTALDIERRIPSFSTDSDDTDASFTLPQDPEVPSSSSNGAPSTSSNGGGPSTSSNGRGGRRRGNRRRASAFAVLERMHMFIGTILNVIEFTTILPLSLQ
ncbi:hypothetical protein GWI33_007170 [Rhynchophorus ferrugineus]|uniref:Uncharacterized protein n=1 Tax=Rhynchophorus ferrugineus TaxID=354439 RepID=A0A834ITJ1_RHYFE|nr:hypothetical protein GWI33_007170 [Rhynchophorus ferrugineus]